MCSGRKGVDSVAAETSVQDFRTDAATLAKVQRAEPRRQKNHEAARRSIQKYKETQDMMKAEPNSHLWGTSLLRH